MLVFLGIVALLCIANRSWIEDRTIGMINSSQPGIHAGTSFKPGVSAVEDGVRQTAVLIRGVPHVQVTSPPRTWLDHHKDAVCTHNVCVATATSRSSGGGAVGDLAALLAALLFGWIVWIMVVDD